jgi:putative transposase
LTDGRGIPLAVVIAGANQVDFKLVKPTLDALVVKRPDAAPGTEAPTTVKFGLCLDKGYDYAEVYDLLAEQGYEAHIRPWDEDALLVKKDPEKKPHRWVVERTPS